jgi:hypothetical protein
MGLFSRKRSEPADDHLTLEFHGVLAAVVKVDRKGRASINLLVEPISIKPGDRERGAALLAGYLDCDHETAYELLWK